MASSSEESSDESEVDEETQRRQAAVWAELVSGSEKPSACSCGLIPCLCEAGVDEVADLGMVLGPPEAEEVEPEPHPRGLALDESEEGPFLRASVSEHLKPHQREGVRFMWQRAVRDGRGCVLADHMGLGKTLQLIATLVAYLDGADQPDAEATGATADAFGNRNRREKTPRTALVVAPAFVLANWESEVSRWAPPRTHPSSRRRRGERDHHQEKSTRASSFTVSPLETCLKARSAHAAGSKASRSATIEAWRDEGGTLLIGYEMFRRLALPESAETETARALRNCGLLVLDEAHRLKDPRSQVYRALSTVSTKRRVLASGYPIQNRLDEYWALVDFARPGALGSYDRFKAYFERPIQDYVEAETDSGVKTLGGTSAGGQRTTLPPEAKNLATTTDAAAEDTDTTGGCSLALRRAFALQDALRDVVLRRGVDELGSALPSRTDWLVHCRLGATQAALYRAFEARALTPSSEFSAPCQGQSLGDLANYHTTLAIVNHPDILDAALAREDAALTDHPFSEEGLDDDAGPDHGQGGWFVPEVRAKTRERREHARKRHEAQRAKLRAKVHARSSRCASPDFLASGVHAGASDETGDLVTELASWARPLLRDPDRPYVPGLLDGDDASGKAVVAVALAAAAKARGERLIVFTQTLGTLDVLERLLASHPDRLQVARIDGATPPAKRQALVARFNSVAADPDPAENQPVFSGQSPLKRRKTTPPPRKTPVSRSSSSSSSSGRRDDSESTDVLLVSIKAGGEGINLVGGSRVVLFDVCWNPCFDQQALSRAHRFGQRRPVHVYRLVGPEGTMEDRVLRQQRRKERLVAEVAEVAGRRSARENDALRLVYGASLTQETHTAELDDLDDLRDDDLLAAVLADVGPRWVDAVHRAVPASAPRTSSLLTARDKAAALQDFRIFREHAGAAGENVLLAS